MKGIILAGGRGTRLLAATRAMNKHMIPLLERPMILYPLETLTQVFGVTEILLVSGGEHIGMFAEFLGDGSEYGAALTYKVQKEAGGIAQALQLARDFCAGQRSLIILGDNVFDNAALKRSATAAGEGDEAHIYLSNVGADARRFGVPTLTAEGRVEALTEKPATPASPYAVTGLYAFPADVFAKAAALKPSARGELEITDLLSLYLQEGRLGSSVLEGFWSDAGTPESLARAVQWVAQNRK